MTTSDGRHYLDYWGFERSPFALTPDPDMLYLSKQHRECMLRLQYAIASNKGGALLVSENPGDGKTSVLRRLEKDLLRTTDEKYRIVFIDHPTLTPNQVFWEILRQLGFGESRGEKIQNLLQLRETLVEMHERGERCIFMLDEGQLLVDRPELLQEFRILLNYTVGETFLLTFIFSGQSELEGVMQRIPELYQRLPVRYFLHSMDLVDTGRMLEHRVRVAGYTGPTLFGESAVREIYRHSKGIPRVICTVADLTLVIGHSRGVRQIGDREVYMAIRDLDRSTQDGYHYYHFLRSAGARSPEEEREIAEAEEALDHEAAEDALRRIEATEGGEAPPASVFDLAVEIEGWRPQEGEEKPATADESTLGSREPQAEGELEEPGEPVTAAPFEFDTGFSFAEAEEDVPDDDHDVIEEPAMPVETEEEAVAGEVDEAEGAGSVEVVEEAQAVDEWVHCPLCNSRQPGGRTNCSQCGGPLHWRCPSCETKNLAQRTRCDHCGQSLSQAANQMEEALREAIASSVGGPDWGFTSTPEFSLKLAEGERVLAVVSYKSRFRQGVKLRARVRAWGNKEQKVTLVVTNHRLHLVARDLQSQLPYHEIQGLRASKGKLLLFHGEGSLRMEYPTAESLIYILVHALIDYLEFQTGLFRV
jgi:type II secretory pathway predicted ATPase ExeA